MRDYVLYRMYGLRQPGWFEEELLYVGVTQNARSRMRDHESKWWWPKVERITLERFPTREALLQAEAAEIRNRRPLCNIQGNPRYNYRVQDCVDEGHDDPPPLPGQLCEHCADELHSNRAWLEEEEGEYLMWYVDPYVIREVEESA